MSIKYLHDRNLIHRDLKADNVYISKYNFVKLGDLGISKIMNSPHMNAHTVVNTVVGTSAYMSPELINRNNYGKKTDIWCIGIILY